MTSSILRFLYGEDYEQNLGRGCINFTKENEDKNSKFFQRVIAFVLVSINLAMGLALFPLWSLIAFFTNWCMIASLLSIVMITYCGSLPDIHLHTGKLACLHLLYEYAFMMNLVVVLVYWGALHAEVIDRFEGLYYLHMYIVHIFPAIGLWLA